jgi:hypothetical protein
MWSERRPNHGCLAVNGIDSHSNFIAARGLRRLGRPHYQLRVTASC